MNTVAKLQLIDDYPPLFYDLCQYAKLTHKTIHKEQTANAFGNEVHTDLWGLSPLLMIGGCKYYVSFTDDYSCYTQLAPLHSKDETLEAYRAYAAWARTQHGAHIK